MSDDQKPEQDQRAAATPGRQPIFNLPPVVAAIAGLFVAIQAIDSFVLNESTRQELLVWLAFIPYRIVDIAAAPGGFWPIVNHGELAVLFCWLFLYIAAQGYGAFALDGLRRRAA